MSRPLLNLMLALALLGCPLRCAWATPASAAGPHCSACSCCVPAPPADAGPAAPAPDKPCSCQCICYGAVAAQEVRIDQPELVGSASWLADVLLDGRAPQASISPLLPQDSCFQWIDPLAGGRSTRIALRSLLI